MSKLYNSYMSLKKENPQKIYLFKSGMFYISLQEDAQKLSEIFNFKITKLNESVNKAGFPISRLEYYTKKLNEMDGIDFEIVDSNYGSYGNIVQNYNDYLNNSKLKNVTDSILKIDLDNVSFKQAYEILEDLKKQINEIYNPTISTVTGNLGYFANGDSTNINN